MMASGGCHSVTHAGRDRHVTPPPFSAFLYAGNEATLSGLEPVAATLLPSSTPDSGKAPEGPEPRPKAKAGLVLEGSLPAIPADLLRKVEEGSYVELAAFLPERITESFLYPEGNKKKLPPIEKFSEWVMAFCCFGLTLAQTKPNIGPDLLTFIGTVARLARDHPGQSWATYEQAFRAKMAADPSRRWSELDNQLHTLCLAPSSQPKRPTPPPPPRQHRPHNLQ